MAKKQATKKQSSGQKAKSPQTGTVATPSRQAVSGYLLCGKERQAGKTFAVLSPWNQA